MLLLHYIKDNILNVFLPVSQIILLIRNTFNRMVTCVNISAAGVKIPKYPQKCGIFDVHDT